MQTLSDDARKLRAALEEGDPGYVAKFDSLELESQEHAAELVSKMGIDWAVAGFMAFHGKC